MKKKERPVLLKSATVRQPTDHGSMFVTITYKTRKHPFEVFVNMGKAGSCEKAWIEALTRSVSLGLRYGVPASEYIDQLSNLQCVPVPDESRGGFVHSPADGVAKVLKDFVEEK